LKPEPSNQFDPHAVMVQVQGKKVGYLSKDQAPAMGAFLRTNEADEATCSARVVGGWIDDKGEEKHYGVKLNISWPPKIITYGGKLILAIHKS